MFESSEINGRTPLPFLGKGFRKSKVSHLSIDKES